MSIEEILNKNENSKLREALVEYMLLEKLIIAAGNKGKRLEISRSDQDLFGYDIILKIDSIVKFVQLKSTNKNSKTYYWDIQKAIISDKNSTVILIIISYTPQEVLIECRVLDESKRTEIINQRPRNRKGNDAFCSIKYGDLIKVENMEELLKLLFSKPVET